MQQAFRTLAVILASIALASGQLALASTRTQLFVFGSVVDIEIPSAPPEKTGPALTHIAAELNRFHRDWHAWEPSALTQLNADLSKGRTVVAPLSIRQLIERSTPLVELSQGYFDPAAGKLIALWGFHTSKYPVTTPAPNDSDIQRWRKNQPSLTDLQREGISLRSRNPAISLDFGAVAEGFAAERVADILRQHGITHALINFGGDVLALGQHPERPWHVGLRDPFGTSHRDAFAVVSLLDGEAVFSSGSYSKYRQSPTGGRWPHVLNLKTGYPSHGTAATAVIHRDAVLADAAATALLAAGPDAFASLIKSMKITCALLVTEDDQWLVTTAMQKRLKQLRPPTRHITQITTHEHCSTPN